jgi:hypothetical protein
MVKVPARPGFEVFFNKGGTISIQQSGRDDGGVVALHPEDVPRLVAILEDMHNDYLLDERERQQAELEEAESPSPPTASDGQN